MSTPRLNKGGEMETLKAILAACFGATFYVGTQLLCLYHTASMF
jgi:hypothetical protein